ncbi:tetratricopeptide repeat protein [Neptunitalea lumnitzerae]|uniref:Tetratricopeptide repeat protein n=1 Tax=Neptunitalea lumnitzerae TaxID=2965509 RepID=A0ABQ5MEN9_9FLAO|nr:hypothetical protein [Neptunitalea sp. Y10]GLB47826.1 hypothetical protein Y10_01940 [Neptunitalea sp. Y10]
MFGVGGSAQAMINSIKNNERLKSKHRSLFKRSESPFSEPPIKNRDKLIFAKTADKAQLTAIRQATLQRQERRNRMLILGGILTLSISAVLVYLNYMRIEEKEQRYNLEVEQRKVLLGTTDADLWNEKLTSNFNFFMGNADDFLKRGKWHNAIYQYDMALKNFPDSFDANYRRALAYAHQCEKEGKECEKANYIATGFFMKFPEHRKQIAIIKKHLSSNAEIVNTKTP